MEKFTTFEGIAGSLLLDNIDTDMIIPKEYLKTITRAGLGKFAFAEMRYNLKDDSLIEDFVLNQAPFNKSSILISSKNFGCGSSREHAPWALGDFGLKVIIAESFADIFFNNCFKNGILPISLDKTTILELVKETQQGENLKIDLPNQEITTISGKKISFKVEEFKKECMINGWDDISLTLKDESSIKDFEEKQKQSQPWLWI